MSAVNSATAIVISRSDIASRIDTLGARLQLDPGHPSHEISHPQHKCFLKASNL